MQKLFGIDLEPDFSMEREERSTQFKYVLWGGLFLIFAYGCFWSLSVRFFQAYVATFVCYGLTFYVWRGSYLRKGWLWKAILASLPLHALYLAGIFWADKAVPELMTKALGFTPVLTLGGGLEVALFGAIADRFKPPNPDDDSQSLRN
jgi:hypothetical protein